MPKNAAKAGQELAPAAAPGRCEEFDYFGPEPLIPGEDPVHYRALRDRIIGQVKPRDVLEDIWVRETVDHIWETLRLRRLKAQLIKAAARDGLADLLSPYMNDSYVEESPAEDLANDWAQGIPKAVKKVTDFFAATGHTTDTVMARALGLKLDEVERIDRLLASAEARRNSALRELDRHRENLASALRRAAEEAEDAEFTEVGPLESSEALP